MDMIRSKCGLRKERRPDKRWIAAIVGLVTLGVSTPALAGSYVYANGTLGAGGQWINPVSTFRPMNFDRMSVTQSTLVIVNFYYIGGGEPLGLISQNGFVNLQNPFGLGARTRADCRNNNTYNLSGYCAWYD